MGTAARGGMRCWGFQNSRGSRHHIAANLHDGAAYFWATLYAAQGFSAVPHSMQNFAPGAGVVPHFGHVADRSEAPHSLQNFALAGSVALHLGHGLVCGAACGAGAGLGCKDGASALPITAPKLMPTPRPTPAPASP